MSADGTSTTQIRKIQQNTQDLAISFTNQIFNTYIVYKPYNTETKVRVEKRAGNYHKCTLGSSLSKRLGPQPPIPLRLGG